MTRSRSSTKPPANATVRTGCGQTPPTVTVGSGYGTFRRDLADVVAGAFAPVRGRTAKYLASFDTLDAVLPGGAWRARVIGGEIMAQVRGRSGFGGAA
jgi:hypothetical protein